MTARTRAVLASLAFAVLLNLDRVILGDLTPVRVHDTCDSVVPAILAVVANIKANGLTSQLPQALCGSTSFSLAPTPNTMTLTAMILPPHVHYILWSILIVLFAALGMWLLLAEDRGMSVWAAAAGAVFFACLHRYWPLGLSVAGLPMMLWSMQRLFDQEETARSRLLMLAWVLLYLNSTYFVLVALVVLPVQLWYLAAFGERRSRRRWAGLTAVSLAYLLLNGPTLAELVMALRGSQRAVRVGDAIGWFDAVRGALVGIAKVDTNQWFIEGPTLVGFAVIGAYVYVLWLSGHRPSRAVRISAATILVTLTIMYASASGPGQWALSHLGPFRTLQINRVGFSLVFLYAFLLAHMIDHLLSSTSTWESGRFPIMAAAGMGTAVGSLLVARELGVVSRSSPDLWTQIAGLLVISAAMALGWRYRSALPRLLLGAFMVFAILTTVSERMIREPYTWRQVFGSPVLEELAAMPGAVEGSYRFAMAQTGDSGFDDPAILMAHGLHTADGYSPLYSRAYRDLWSVAISPAIRSSERDAEYFLEWGSRAYLFDSAGSGTGAVPFDLDLLRLMGVRFLVSSGEVGYAESAGLIRVSSEEQGTNSDGSLGRWSASTPVSVYELPGALPVAFGTSDIRVFDSSEAMLAGIGQASIEELGASTFVIGADHDVPTLDPESNVEVLEFVNQPDRILARVAVSGTALLNVSRNHGIGWRSTINGTPADILPAYGAFMAVPLPPGEHLVEFVYENPLLASAWWALLLGTPLCMLVLWTLSRATR